MSGSRRGGVWRRLGRLVGQSRIRLPRRGLSWRDLHRGDRLEIGSGIWRIESAAMPTTTGCRFRLLADASKVSVEAQLVVIDSKCEAKPRRGLDSCEMPQNLSPDLADGASVSEASSAEHWLLLLDGDALPLDRLQVIHYSLAPKPTDTGRAR